MLKIALFGSVAVLLCTAVQARALPSDDIDRAIACSVYGGFAPEADPRTAPTNRVIHRIVEHAIASGARTKQQLQDELYVVGMPAMKEAPRE